MKNILFVNKEKVRDKNFHLLRQNFPFQRYELVPSYTFSYQAYHTNEGYANTYNGSSTSSLGISKALLPKIGKEEGVLKIFLSCTETQSEDNRDVIDNIRISLSEKRIDITL